jgi:hypothetical protein
MPKAVVCTGEEEEFSMDMEVTHVTIADGVTEIKEQAFERCKGLTNLSFLEGSAITTIGFGAFLLSGIISLLGMEGVRKIGHYTFAYCKDLRTIEGLGCEEMGDCCFAGCTLLQSMKGWPTSMTVIPAYCFRYCTGMTTVECDLSHVTSIEPNAFVGCTSLLPPSLSEDDAEPAAVLAYLKEKSRKERATSMRYATYACIRRARDQENEPRTGDSPIPLAFALAKLPPDMNRVIVEFLLGVVLN